LVWDEAVIAQSGVDLVRLYPSLLEDPHRTIDTYVRWFPYFPPLMSIVLSLAYAIFGISETVARSVSVCFNLLGLITTFLLGREAFDESAGIASVLLLSVMPIYWHMSRVAMLDVASVFFFALTLHLYYKGLSTNRIELILLAGFPLGLGMLTKYPNILCVPIIFVPMLLGFFDRKKVDWRPVVCLLLALELAFFIFIPWFYKTTIVSQSWRGWIHEIRPGKQYKWLMAEYWIGSLNVPFLQMTLPLGILALLAVAYSLKQRSKADIFLLSWAAVVFLWFVPIHKDLRYTMPYLPALAILSGRLVSHISVKLVEQFAGTLKGISEERLKGSAGVTLMLVLLMTSPILYGLATQPKGLQVPIPEAFSYIVENMRADGNVLVLLSCNNLSQHASYFYMYMVAGLDASIHILIYPSSSVDWYDPGPINTTRIAQLCIEKNIQYIILWDGSPYSESWLPVLLDSNLFVLKRVVGSKSNAIFILEF
jgi:4-amino-4-deoxy-L-arabinose transferase-like glycosyltransferase